MPIHQFKESNEGFLPTCPFLSSCFKCTTLQISRKCWTIWDSQRTWQSADYCAFSIPQKALHYLQKSEFLESLKHTSIQPNNSSCVQAVCDSFTEWLQPKCKNVCMLAMSLLHTLLVTYCFSTVRTCWQASLSVSSTFICH